MNNEEVYNKYKRKVIVLSEGEEFCKKCRGRGVVYAPGKLKNPSFTTKVYPLRCNECLGDGKIDWIEKVTGKQKTMSGTDGAPA